MSYCVFFTVSCYEFFAVSCCVFFTVSCCVLSIDHMWCPSSGGRPYWFCPVLSAALWYIVCAEDLLRGFFQFFAGLSLDSSVISTRTGTVVPLKNFLLKKLSCPRLDNFKVLMSAGHAQSHSSSGRAQPFSSGHVHPFSSLRGRWFKSPAVPICCVLDQDTYPVLLQSTQLTNEYQTGSSS